MIVTFLTRRLDHKLNNNPLIIQLNPSQYDPNTHILRQSGRELWGTAEDGPISYSGWFVLGHDIENRYKAPSREGLLLSAFCNSNDEVLVIDNTSVDNTEIFTPEILKRCFFIAHNADHEARWGAVTGFLPMRYGCTMVNDKRLLSGQQGFRFDIISCINRRLGIEHIPVWMEKDVRSQFKDCEFLTDELILYNASDTIKLKLLYFAQLREAQSINQQFLHGTINSRIIIPVAKAETTGIKHDSDKWITIAKERQEKANIICQELSETITTIHGVRPEQVNPSYQKKLQSLEKRNQKNQERKVKLELQLRNLEERNKTHLKSYKVSQDQLQKLANSTMEQTTVSVTTANAINWGSQKQVIKVFELIGCPVPEAKDNKTHKMKVGVGKEHRANWFVANEDSPFIPLMKKYEEYKKTQHNVNSFGENWVTQYVRNGRAYTLLDQAGTDTGRFSSGSKARPGQVKEYANMQQIPKEVDKLTKRVIYRECFVADPGRMLITLDYSNCEGSVMTALSGDLNMQKILHLADSHSYLGTKCWRNIYAYRYNKTKDPKYLELSLTYEMNKTSVEKEKERDIFKNSGGLFPVAYGVAASKVGATSKITEAEAQVMIDTIKGEIPEVIKYLDSKSEEAVKKGYVLHNTRTGSRRWFTPILDNIHYGFPLSKSDKAEVEFAARNSPIQGGNADLMKESIAMVDLWTKLFKQDVRFLLTVHDEAVYDVPEDRAEFYAPKIKELMKRAAKFYLIPEVVMDVDCRIAKYWKK